MMHEMRRKDRELTQEEAVCILEKGSYGILSTIGEDGYPYGVPLSYAYENGTLYFHCAADVGYKLENISYHDKVSFTVVGDTCVLPEKFATKYESVIVFGTIAPSSEKQKALEELVKKYSPGYEVQGKDYAKAAEKQVGVFELKIERMTGKARR